MDNPCKKLNGFRQDPIRPDECVYWLNGACINPDLRGKLQVERVLEAQHQVCPTKGDRP